jgi:hypothetical protein
LSDSKATSRLGASDRLALYAARRFVNTDVEKKVGVRIPFDVYFQDPTTAENEELVFDKNFYIGWEPGLGDGPTSARFAVVDYNGDSGTLTPPATWMGDQNAFFTNGKRLDSKSAKLLQFDQVSVWAVLKNALDFFEGGFGLGRQIPWGFEGNRLIVVPHAGYGENAYYDRESKSLQFYYFDGANGKVFTCKSTDIINHEFGHAVLDGIRPYYIEAILPETAAFHEFIGDLTAILIVFRNNEFRKRVLADTGGDLSTANALERIGEQFGREVTGRDYLRSARNPLTMRDVAGNPRPHHMSQVLTGAMFDIIIELSRIYIDRREQTVPRAFWNTIQRMQRMAIQPLDLLPPVDVTFKDYALAVLRAEEIANPVDPRGYRRMMRQVFEKRGILSSQCEQPEELDYTFDRPKLSVFHDVGTIAGSRSSAYRFLDDNRRDLFLPADQDIIVSDLYTAEKLGRQALRQPSQVVVQYVWREDVLLEGAQFGSFDGRMTSMLCGGTLVLDQNGTLLSWTRKPGSRSAGNSAAAEAEAAEGLRRRETLLEAVAIQLRAGRIGIATGGAQGLLGRAVSPLTSRDVGGSLRFELSPHMGLHSDADEILGGRRWEISS